MALLMTDPFAAVMRVALVFIVSLSIGNFSPKILPTGLSPSFQQYVALSMWSLVIFTSLFVRPILRVRPSMDLVVALGFYAFAVASVAWSNYALDSALKGVALAVVTFATYRLVCSMTIETIVDCAIFGMFAVFVASIGLVIFVPQIGLVTTWMHNGQWQGVFESKQSLGVAGAFLMFFSCQRLMTRGGLVWFLLTFGAAAACVVGSESRGGGMLALAAVAMLYLSGRSPSLRKFLAFGPLIMTIAALILITYLIATGNDYLPLFDEKLNLTERTYIWEYALRHFDQAGAFGFGLDGFWSVDSLHYQFLHEHNWFLDNFHSGYIAILIESGVIGMALFTLCCLLFSARMAGIVSTGSLSGAHYNLIIGFINLSFFINFTETFFLRSTNLISVLVTGFFIISSCEPVRWAQRRLADRKGPLVAPEAIA